MHPAGIGTRCSLREELKAEARYQPVKAAPLFVAKVGKLWAKITHASSCGAFQHEPPTQNFLQSIIPNFPSLMPKGMGIVMNQKDDPTNVLVLRYAL